jgi:hypothetical protein
MLADQGDSSHEEGTAVSLRGWRIPGEPGVQCTPLGHTKLLISSACVLRGNATQGYEDKFALQRSALQHKKTSWVDVNLQQVLMKCENACKSETNFRAENIF